MNNLKIYFKDGHNFAKKYLREYFLLLSKPILIGLVGFASVFLSHLGFIGAILALIISLPCMCYAFWQGYLITYSLNYLAVDFVQNNQERTLIDCYNLSKEKAKELATYLFLAIIVSFLIMIPSLVIVLKSGISFDMASIISNFSVLSVNGLILIPFFNFLTQIFFFKKDDENFSDLFIGCYKKLNVTGIFLSIFFTIIGTMIGINIIIYVILALVLNLYAYSINTFWYYSRIKNEEV